MQWEKKGKICSCDDFTLSWYKKNTMVPVPLLLDEERIRIFVTFCDADNIGRIGYVDVAADNPGHVLDYSKTPLIDTGDAGCFDDNGVVTASLLRDGDALYMFYSGYQACVKVPYLIFAGVAKSVDGGSSFQKLTTRVPVLDRIEGECGTRCVPYVMRDGGIYRMWYTADYGNGWVKKGDKMLPLYDMKYLESSQALQWPRVAGLTAVPLKNEDEHGIAKCTVWKEDGLFKMIYSIRALSSGYRLGYGESADGRVFTRMDDRVGIDVSPSGWDSEMVAFAERLATRDKTYLFYCGNHYGMAGMGYAELIEK